MEFTVEESRDPVTWNETIAGLPFYHILQTWDWAEHKEKYGWHKRPFLWRDSLNRPAAAAMILRREFSLLRLRTRLAIDYIPRGPLVDWENEAHYQSILDALQKFSRKGSIFLKIDPEVVIGRGASSSTEACESTAGLHLQQVLIDRGWRFSESQIQFRNTMLVDITVTEDDLLANMKQKTRYNVRLAARRGVSVRQGGLDDLPALYRLYVETSLRDGFVIRSEDYYSTLWRSFVQKGLARVLVAEVGGEVIAGLILFIFAGKTWFFYGMSRDVHREKMPSHLLQWEAMRLARQMGCQRYDMWGAPDNLQESDVMWGVYKFKEGFGGTLIRTIGAWDYVPRRGIYTLFIRILPALLSVMRTRRIKAAHQELS